MVARKDSNLKILTLALFSISGAFGQLTTASTTLANAITPGTTSNWCLNSAVNVVTPSIIRESGSYLVVDAEIALIVAAGPNSTCFRVARGQFGTSANVAHSSGATVWISQKATYTNDTSSPFTGGALIATIPSGSCVATDQYMLPLIAIGSPGGLTGQVITCTGGQWVNTSLGGAASLPNPSSSTLGGVQSAAAQAGKLMDSISTLGVPNLRALVSGDIPANAANTSGTAAAVAGKTFLGSATQIPLFLGTPAGAKCVHTDGSGNLTEAAADCGAGGGGMTYPGGNGVAVVSGGAAWGPTLGVGSGNAANAIVQRDGSGNFAATTVTANLTGNASGSAATITGFDRKSQHATYHEG